MFEELSFEKYLIHIHLITSVGGGVRGLLGDTANVGLSDLDVARFTPRWAPGVLDEEVVLTILSTVADGENTVVKLGTAGGAGDDTTSVALEGHSVGLNGNRDGLLGNGGLEGSTGFVRGDIVEAGNGDGTTLLHGLVASAGSASSGGVRVGVLSDHGGGLGVLESVVHEATIAARVGLGALDELFLGEGNKGAGGKEVSTLHGTGGGESPAGTALSLVLDGGDGTLGSPVDGVGEVLGGELLDGVGLLHVSLVAIHGSSLFGSVVSELVDTDSPGVAVGRVVLFNELEVLREVVESVLVLAMGGVLSVVLSNESEESVLGGGDGLVLAEEVGDVGENLHSKYKIIIL